MDLKTNFKLSLDSEFAITAFKIKNGWRIYVFDKSNYEVRYANDQEKPFWRSSSVRAKMCKEIEQQIPTISRAMIEKTMGEFADAETKGDLKGLKEDEPAKAEEKPEMEIRYAPGLTTKNYVAEEVWDGVGLPRFCLYNFDTEKFTYADYLDLGETNEKGQPIVYHPVFNDHLRKGMVILPREPKETTFKETVEDIFKFLLADKHFDSCGSETQVKLLGLIALGSQFLDRLKPSIPIAGIGRFAPIIGVRGPSGSGKNRLANLLRLCSQRPYFDMSKLNIPSLFRPLDIWRGTLVLDEMDFDKTGETSELIHFLNCRATGTPISRQDPNSPQDSQAFDNFGLTIVTQRRQFDDNATEGRTVPFFCEKTDKKLPTVELDETIAEGMEIQDRLLYLRMKYWREFNIDKEAWIEDISDPRLNAALLPAMTIAKFEPSVADIVKSVVKQIEETKVRQKANSMDGVIIGFLWDHIEDGHLAQYLNFYYLEMVEKNEDGYATRKPMTVRGIADKLGWKQSGWVRKILNSLNVVPREVPPVIKLEGKTYRPIFVDPVRLEKLLREFVVGYERNKLFSVLRISPPYETELVKRDSNRLFEQLGVQVTEVTEVTAVGCVGGVKREDIEVTEVTPECHPRLKNDINNAPDKPTPTHPNAVTSVTSVTEEQEPPSQDAIIKYLKELARGTQSSKAHIEATLGVSHSRLQVAIDHMIQRGAPIIDRGATIEVL